MLNPRLDQGFSQRCDLAFCVYFIFYFRDLQSFSDMGYKNMLLNYIAVTYKIFMLYQTVLNDIVHNKPAILWFESNYFNQIVYFQTCFTTIRCWPSV